MRLIKFVLVKLNIAFVKVVISRHRIVSNSFFVLFKSILHVSLVIVRQTQIFVIKRKVFRSSIRVLLYKFRFKFDCCFVRSQCSVELLRLKLGQP